MLDKKELVIIEQSKLISKLYGMLDNVPVQSDHEPIEGDTMPSGDTQQSRQFNYIENAKITYPDAKEVFYPDFVNNPKKWLEVEDGTLTFSVPKEVLGTTPNSNRSRCELRFYKDAKTKKNWQYDELIVLHNEVMFHKLQSDESCFFAQVHGLSTKPYYKFDAGKGMFRLLCGLKEDSSSDYKLEFDMKPEEGVLYEYYVEQGNGYITATLTNIVTGEQETQGHDKYDRKDEKYAKLGAYGYGPIKVQHFAL
jgi:hypothetical protein